MVSEFLFLGKGTTTKTRKSRKIFFFRNQIVLDFPFDQNFNFSRVKAEINKDRLNLKNLGGSEALKRQISATSLAFWLNRFEFDVI